MAGSRRLRFRSRALARLAVLLALAPLASGCVERFLLVRSDPPGANVHIDGAPAGVTPLAYRFDFYGEFDVVVRHPGHLSLRRLERVYPPWWEIFPLDFVTELLLPIPLRDEHSIEVSLRDAPGELDPDARSALERRRDALLEQGARLVPSTPAPPVESQDPDAVGDPAEEPRAEEPRAEER